jgi:hypothetical protein
MAKQIIVLEKSDTADKGFRVALWAVPPVARQPYWKLSAPTKSAWSGASQAENDAIANGQVIEQVETITSDTAQTMAGWQALAEQRWETFNANVQAANPWRRYGTFWDGTTWTPGGVT